LTDIRWISAHFCLIKISNRQGEASRLTQPLGPEIHYFWTKIFLFLGPEIRYFLDKDIGELLGAYDTRSSSLPRYLCDFNIFGSFFRSKWTVGPEKSVTLFN
jgi:hypothetical protein